jgi:penicillin amidase
VPGTASPPATLRASVSGASASVTLQPGPANATLHLAGLGASVQVLYDEREIPHIRCAAATDCFAVQGWLHARDRLFQMDFLRHVATGTLAELVGELGLSQDVQLRTLFTTRAGQRLGDSLAAAMDPTTRAAVVAYLSGVNGYLASLKAPGAAPLPAEYAQLPVPVAAADIPDFTPSDVLSLARLQQYQLSETLSEETAYGTFAETYGPGAPSEDLGKLDVWIRAAQPSSERSHTLTGTLPTPLGASRPSPRSLASMAPWASALAATRAQAVALRRLLQPFAGSAGSNDWVVDAAHSASGHAMVANDPHLSLQYPPNFHLSTLTSSNPADHLDLTGGAFPGLPGALVGRGKSVGWGVTVVGYDVTDIYLEQALPSSACTGGPLNTAFCVLFNGAPAYVLAYPQVWRIRTAAGLHVLTSAELTAMGVPAAVAIVPHHGPIVQAPDAGGHAVSVRWTGHEDWTDDLHAFLGLDTAADVDAAMAALDSYSTGAQNFVLADEAGHIAYYPHALVPVRTFADVRVVGGNVIPPWFPLPGDGTAEWGTGVAADHCDGAGGTVPAAACWIDKSLLPQGKDPARGFFITANADPLGVSDDNQPLLHPPYLSFDWDDSTAFRHARITERLTGLIAANGTVTLADMEAIQGDHVSRLGAAFERIIAALPAGAAGSDLELARALLAQWKVDGFDCPTGLDGTDPSTSPDDPDPTHTTDSAACYLFHAFTRTLLENVFADDLAVAGLDVNGGQAVKGMLYMLENPTTADQSFCDDAGGARRTCTRQVVTALTTAFDTLAAIHGADRGLWRWGRVHTMQPVSLFAPVVGAGFEPGPFARPGGAFTVDVGNPSLSGSGPSFAFGSSGNVRHVSVMDPAAPQVRMQLPGPERDLPTTGTVAGPDLLGEWVRNQYFDFKHGGQIDAFTVSTLTFDP